MVMDAGLDGCEITINRVASMTAARTLSIRSRIIGFTEAGVHPTTAITDRHERQRVEPAGFHAAGRQRDDHIILDVDFMASLVFNRSISGGSRGGGPHSASACGTFGTVSLALYFSLNELPLMVGRRRATLGRRRGVSRQVSPDLQLIYSRNMF